MWAALHATHYTTCQSTISATFGSAKWIAFRSTKRATNFEANDATICTAFGTTKLLAFDTA